MAYPTITDLPSAPARTQSPSAFATTADAFVAALPGLVTEVNAAGAYIDTQAAAVETDAATASSAADAAVAAAGATAWVSGASYAAGDVVWSPTDFQTYRAKTTHSGVATDPSADTTNWSQISLSGLADYTGNVSITGEFKATSYNESYSALSGTTPSVDCEAGNVFSLTTSGNTTFTFANPPATGTAFGFTLKVTAGGTHTLTWPASVDWAGGTAPDAPASGETNVLVFITHDGGTTWYGFQAGAALA